MGRGPRYSVKFRRRRECRTDYRMRKIMIMSHAIRLVERCSSRNIVLQVVKSLPEGDTTLVSAWSREIAELYGWKAYCGNLPAAYLTGFLLGHKALFKGVESAILDLGLKNPPPGARLYAALKGTVDAGLQVPHDEMVLPKDSRITGEHIATYAKKLAEEEPQLYDNLFSGYLSNNLKPEQIAKHFKYVKKNISNAFSSKSD